MGVTIGDIGTFLFFCAVLLMIKYDVDYYATHDEFKNIGQEEERGIQ